MGITTNIFLGEFNEYIWVTKRGDMVTKRGDMGN